MSQNLTSQQIEELLKEFLSTEEFLMNFPSVITRLQEELGVMLKENGTNNSNSEKAAQKEKEIKKLKEMYDQADQSYAKDDETIRSIMKEMRVEKLYLKNEAIGQNESSKTITFYIEGDTVQHT